MLCTVILSPAHLDPLPHRPTTFPKAVPQNEPLNRTVPGNVLPYLNRVKLPRRRVPHPFRAHTERQAFEPVLRIATFLNRCRRARRLLQPPLGIISSSTIFLHRHATPSNSSQELFLLNHCFDNTPNNAPRPVPSKTFEPFRVTVPNRSEGRFLYQLALSHPARTPRPRGIRFQPLTHPPVSQPFLGSLERLRPHSRC